MDYLQQKQTDIIANVLAYFSARMATDPHGVLRQVDAELQSLYVRYGNDWTGRGIVGDTTQEATIAALEGVRAECLSRIHDAAKAS